MYAQEILQEVDDPNLSIVQSAPMILKYRDVEFSVYDIKPGTMGFNNNLNPHCKSTLIGIIEAPNYIIAVIKMMNAIDQHHLLNA